MEIHSGRPAENEAHVAACRARFEGCHTLNGEAVERWLRDQADAGMSAGTRNGYRRACVAFANWCVRTNRYCVPS